MSRQALALGTYGNIPKPKQQDNGSYRATTRYRDYDGVTRPVQAFGPTAAKARDRLKEALQERGKRQPGAATVITRNTTMSELADLWLAELEVSGNTLAQTIDGYREEINVSTDKRASKSTVKIKSALGGLRIWEADTPRLDHHLKQLAASGLRGKARLHRVILLGMMGMAVRHGAIDENPVRDVARLAGTKAAKPRAIDVDGITALRRRAEAWLAGNGDMGTPVHVSGPKRDRVIWDIAEVMIATGARPGEVLAIRWCDLDLAAAPPRLAINGTIVRTTDRGLFRQDHTKTGDDGIRTVLLPGFAVAVLMRLKVGALPNEHDLVFPTRKGTPREPHNFNRSWRALRGTEFEWVTPKTFRKAVATLIAGESTPEQAGHQLGHVPGSKITQRHYIERSTVAPDSTAILDRFGG